MIYFEWGLVDTHPRRNESRHHTGLDNRDTDPNRIFLALAVLMISEGKLRDATGLVARVGEERRMHGVFSLEHWWLSLYTHLHWGLGGWRRHTGCFEVTKGLRLYCEAQQELNIRAFGTREMGRLRLKKVFKTAETRFQELGGDL